MKIKDLLTDESKWTKNTFARNEEGSPTILQQGTCWCLLGGVRFCYLDGQETETKIRDKLNVDSIALWNDAPERTFSDVKKLVEELDI